MSTSLSLTRIAVAEVVAATLARRGLKRGSLSASGALAAFVVGTVIMGADWSAGAALIFFYASGTVATRVGAAAKAAVDGEARGGGGNRGVTQVLATAGVAALLACALLVLQCLPVDVAPSAAARVLAMAAVASLACSCGDTWASELGILSRGDPVLVTTCRRVPRGTNGGVTAAGTALSVAGGAAVGAVAAATAVATTRVAPDWAFVAVGAVAGGAGSLVDSVLGATVQRTWRHTASGRVVSRLPPGAVIVASGGDDAAPPDQWHTVVSGVPVLSNEGVNAVSCALVAAAYVAYVLATGRYR